jgi:hypothetical protein
VDEEYSFVVVMWRRRRGLKRLGREELTWLGEFDVHRMISGWMLK